MTTAPQEMHKSSHSVSRLRVALGTLVAIDAEAGSETLALQGIAAAFAAVCTVERLMHPARPGSDLAALASCAPGTQLTVHPWTWEVLELCRRLNQASLGVFDPCLALAPGRMADLELEPGDKIRARAPLRIDLGGIAKGYAVDRAIEALQTTGCTSGLVNAGGDLAVFGAGSRRILCGHAPDTAGVWVELRDAALASSDAAQASRPAEHRGYYHGADRSLTVAGKVTVMAASAAVADGMTKCLLSADRALRGNLLRTFGARQINTSSRAAAAGASANA
jgi:FAD:protein FMN transferase